MVYSVKYYNYNSIYCIDIFAVKNYNCNNIYCIDIFAVKNYNCSSIYSIDILSVKNYKCNNINRTGPCSFFAKKKKMGQSPQTPGAACAINFLHS